VVAGGVGSFAPELSGGRSISTQFTVGGVPVSGASAVQSGLKAT